MKIKLLLTVLILSLFLKHTVVANANEQSMTLNMKEDTAVFKNVSTLQKTVTYDDDSFFFVRSVDFKTTNLYTTSFKVKGTKGTYSYFDKNKKMITRPLANGILLKTDMIIIDTNEYHMFLGQPYMYKVLGQGVIKETNSLATMKISKQSDDWVVTYSFKPQKTIEKGLLYGVGSNKILIDVKDQSTINIWKNYDFTKKAKLGIDGYYYECPSSYTPYEKGAYWNSPSMYLINAMVKNGGSPLSDILATAYLSIAENNINQEGFIPSQPESNWLKETYGIGGGYFDTRYNADMIEIYLLAYQNFGIESYQIAYLQLANYYLKHGENNHVELYLSSENADSQENLPGWLVEDYGNGDNQINTHTALNHQLQAIHIFLKLYELEGDQVYLDYASKMIRGIEYTQNQWIMPNRNLEYAYMPDGQMGYIDYEYLTYNDFYKVQNDLIAVNGTRNFSFDILMGSKREWMKANDISNYSQ
jgi:hypothetical protein